MNKLNIREKKVESYKIEEMPDKYHSKWAGMSILVLGHIDSREKRRKKDGSRAGKEEEEEPQAKYYWR
jgi:hypothetical protein